MDENKVIRPMDFVRLTNIDELNVIKDTKNHIGLVKEVSRDGAGATSLLLVVLLLWRV